MEQVRAPRVSVRIAGQDFLLDADLVTRELEKIFPEPLNDHYVVVGGRRYPPKQIIALVTRIDRADFTTHQARRVLRRLGFTVGRTSDPPAPMKRDVSAGPHGGTEADLLRPFVGQWVAQRGMEVLIAAERPEDVLAWLERHDQLADAMFHVPARLSDTTGVAPS